MKVPKVDKKTNIKIEIGVSLAVVCMIALYSYNCYLEGRNIVVLYYGAKKAFDAMDSMRNGVFLDPHVKVLPASNEEAHLDPPEQYKDEYIQSVTIVKGAVIVVEFTEDFFDGDAVMVWRPDREKRGAMQWECETYGIAKWYFRRWIQPCETHKGSFDMEQVINGSN